MAKKKTSSAPAWKTNWPKNGDLKAWFLCMLDKCAAIENSDEASTEAHLPIDALSELGFHAQALKQVNRFLGRLPPDEIVEAVRMNELGAKICLRSGDLKGVERYLAQATEVEKHIKRKCYIGFPANSVREFKARHGLLDPAEAVDEEQRVDAAFHRAQRQVDQALAEKQMSQAREALAVMEAASREMRKWRRNYAYTMLLRRLVAFGDGKQIERFLKKLSKDEREELLDESALRLLGRGDEANKRIIRDIDGRLKELREMNDPNIHFPVGSICRSLERLAELGEKQLAKRCLKKVLASMSQWSATIQGWTTAAVYNDLAKAVGQIEGTAAAQQFLDLAHQDAGTESRPGMKKGALSASIGVQADLGQFEEALAAARKLRSKPHCRLEVGKLLARAGRWKELREVLSEVASPQEAAKVMWWIKFELPGGQV
jgi:tetratricopeptide (TPR) repeat protein